MSLAIRPATRDDAAPILALLPRLAAFDVPPRRDPNHLWHDDAELLRAWIEGSAPQCEVIVAEHLSARRELLGVVIASLRPELLSHAPSAHIEALAVAENAQSRGVGAALIAAAEAAMRARGAETMTLHVFARNTRARALYERAGYDGELLRYIKYLD